MLDNIPYGQFVRLKHICNKDNDSDVKAREMKTRFVQREYKDHVTDTAINKSKVLNREELFVSSCRLADNRVTFVSEYNTISGRVENIIKKHWSVLKCDPALQHISASMPMFCYKRDT